MKKLLVMTLTLASFGFLGLGASEAKASTVMEAPQIRIQLGQRDRGRRHYRVRTVRQTRIVQRGWRRYRETYLVRYYPNGQTQTTLISRERIS
jgi:hypothetical protein